MAKITCLKAMFARKGKLKVTASDGVEGDKLYELTQKGANIEEDSLFAMADPATLDAKLAAASVGSITSKLLSVPSIAEWAKHENALCWSEQSDKHCAEPAKTSPAAVFEFETGDMRSMGSNESDKPGIFANSPIHVVDTVGEVAYEGGDEDDELEDARDLQKFESAQYSEGSSTGELSPDEERSGFTVDNGSATYFEFHSNAACVSENVSGRFFDEEATGDYVSDPGIYDDNDLGSGHSNKEPDRCHFGCQSVDADFTHKETRSEGGLSDMELISRQDPSKLTGHDMMLVAHDSPSSVDVSSKEMSKNVVESPYSEVALCDANDTILNVKFSEDGIPILKQKPWWKVFLVTHRNIHREQKALIASSSLSRSDMVLVSNAAGYSSDADYCSGSVMFASDVFHPESIAIGPDGPKIDRVLEPGDNRRLEQINGKKVDTKDSEPVQSVASPSSSMPQMQGRGKDPKAFQSERPDLRRVEEWISSIDPILLQADDEFETQSDLEPNSPSAPAASFFQMGGLRADQGHPADGVSLLDRREHHGDPTLDADAEMASLIAQSVNPLSTVAHFSGVGLRLIPPLGMFNNLKTLNFSANALVRIVPGHLPKSLHSLDLSRNKISVIEGLRELTRLRVLNLSHNRISRIGHGLANCTSLRELQLAGNKISEVEGLHRLLKLSYVDLSFNKLSSAKSIAQLAANYNSLQAINLLGNALHSNLGEEPLRKLVSGLAPHILYLNKQAMKTVSARDAAVDSVARAALGTTSHHTHQRGKTSTHSKALRRGAPSVLPSAPTVHRGRARSGNKAATTSSGLRPSSHKSRPPSELASHHRHPHSGHGQGLALAKEHTRFSHPSLVSLAQSSSPLADEDARSAAGAVAAEKPAIPRIPRIWSDGSLHIKS